MILFWIGALFVGYTYVGYPVLIWILARRRPAIQPPEAAPTELPSIAFIVAAFNERSRIRSKVESLLGVHYPAELRQVIVVSDGSTDGTEDEIPVDESVTTLRQLRTGKPSALNRAVRAARSDIVVFCDVRQVVDPDAPRRLVARLADPTIGAVGGELQMLASGSATTRSIGAYWSYEKTLRSNESRIDSSVGLSGALYAMRRVDWDDLPEDTVLDDLLVPMQLIRRGYRVVVEPAARFTDAAQDTLEGERRRKLRTLSGNFQLFRSHPWVLSPLRNRLWWQFYSHKVFRLLVPYALIAMLAGTAIAVGVVARTFFWLQIACYVMAYVGLRSSTLRKVRLFNAAAMFLDLNMIALRALPASRPGRIDARWEKT